MKSSAYALAYRAYHAAFRVVAALPPPWPQRFERASRALKQNLFPGEHAGSSAAGDPGAAPAPGGAPAFAWTPPPVPDWALEEMKKIALEVDPALYPYPQVVASMQLWSIPPYEQPGLAYADLRRCLRHDAYTHVFVLPWLKTGGLDLVALEFIAAAAAREGNRVLVVTTEDAESPWAASLPAGVELAELGRRMAAATGHERMRVLTRLVVQLKPRILHLVNSAAGWEMVRRHGKALRSTARLYASCVVDDLTEYGTLMSYARNHLPDCYPQFEAVLTDTDSYPRRLVHDYGLPRSLFRVVHTPFPVPSEPVFRANPASRRVLWAGRLDRQKRPDLLAAIAARLPDHEFHVFGAAVLGADGYLPALERLPNVRFRGSFAGFESIPAEGWCCFLLTSEWEGLPTVLLGATAAGLPIVAPDVGGVTELVDATTGFPVARFDDIDAFVAEILAVGGDPGRARARWQAAHERLATRHSHAAFSATVASLPGYLDAKPAAAAAPAVVRARREAAFTPDLIIDVGMHHGQDTEFYLKKGFRVVAVEANPDFCLRVGERLRTWVEAGRLTILNVGVGVEPGVMDFYRNLDKDDWSSFDKAWGTKEGTRAEIIKVKTVDFADILREHGMPYYLKIDVEGCDEALVRSLHRFATRPRYLSMEEHECHYFGDLYAIGARAFKVINQATHWQHSLPNPPREGVYVDQKFELGASGPFGDETVGEWMGFGQALDWYLKNVRNEQDQLFATNGWHDIHVRIDRID